MTFTVDDSIGIMKALADSSRLLIINSLYEKAYCVEELSERLDLSASTVSFHLKKLEQANLVIKTKNQYYSEFQINHDIFKSTLRDLSSFENIEKLVHEERVNTYRNKVLSTFIQDGWLVKMPAQQKKRLIILDWFAKQFDKNKTYTEKEASDLIAQHFDDYCLIRRDLVDFRFMERSNQQYKLRDYQL
jgi:ArsR family transcriptional regulator, arsenate/arsenite/antimonite-responsive transcriptional repressor